MGIIEILERIAGVQDRASTSNLPLQKLKSTPDTFTEMFKGDLNELNSRYIEGTFDYLRQQRPDLYQKINETEKRLNEVWKACLQGKAGIVEFRKVLEQWTCLLENAIEIYS